MASANTLTIQTRKPVSTRKRFFDEWVDFFRDCWRRAKHERKFEVEARKLALRCPLSGTDLFNAWGKHVTREQWVSFRTLQYFDILLDLRLLSQTDVLRAITARLPYVFAKEAANPASIAPNADASVLAHLATAILNRIQASGGKSKPTPVTQSMRLFQLIGAFTGVAESKSEPPRGPALALANAISNYLVAHVNDLSANGLLVADKGNPPVVLKKAFSKVVPRFIQILENAGSPLKDSLILLQQQSKLQEEIDEGGQNGIGNLVDSVSYQQNVADMPIQLGRASFIAYLSSLLTGRPKADDRNLRTFLQARYQSDIQTLATDLIVFSFHALAAALERKDNQEVIVVHRSFIPNKLPLLLEEYSPLLFGEKSMADIIGDAVKQIDDCYKDSPVLLPRQDADPKQRFLLASALIGLIQESQIPTLLGYSPTQGLPSVGRYNKTELIRQCQADSKRIEQLVDQMVAMEGNTGPIARALLELIYILCASRETMTLKVLCNAFLRKSVTLNYMLLFTEPRILLQPLCQLLDNWPTDDPSAEPHPVYDEFGSILLFIQVCRHRYDLPISAFGRESPDSFVLSFFRNGSLSKPVARLSDADKQHLSGWIKSLFESNAISDETMSNCSPKDFYSLVATFVDQSLIACQSGVLNLETVKGGFEFLYEPFLLPSLVPVLSWFSSRLLGTQGEAPQLDYVMPLLSLLVKPPKLAPETSLIHNVILTIVATPLSRSLSHVKALHRRADVSPLLDTVTRLTRNSANMTNSVPFGTYEKWLNIPNGGLEKTLVTAYEELLKLNGPVKAKPFKPSYDHRLMHHVIESVGPYKSLKVLLTQTWKYLSNSKPQQHDFALDTLTGLISADATDPTEGRACLRDALQVLVGEVHILAKRHASKAEFVVRLSRRVEVHCTKPVEQIPVISALNGGGGADAGAAGALDASAIAAAVSATAGDTGVAGGTQDLMAGISTAAGLADASQLGQLAGDAMDMGDMVDLSLNDYMQDFDTLGGQSIDDIFAQL